MIAINILNDEKINIHKININDVGKIVTTNGIEYVVISYDNNGNIKIQPKEEYYKRVCIVCINGIEMSLKEAEQQGYDITKYLKEL
ncbi:hypothetical protein HYH40_17075 [Clostridium botulinum]|nr:hypothetical protein [Clostridium botulinum]MBY6949849.1 hypothetical protein [Clostridium botulinum]